LGLLDYFASVGITGVFLASLVSNAIPYSAMPYLAVVAAYAAAAPSEKLIIAAAGGAGATLGKLVLYSLSRLVGAKIGRKRRENLEYFNKLLSGKTAFLAVFLFAALPLPDDVLYIPLGLSGYAFMKFLVPLFIGKVFLVGLIAFLGSQARALLDVGVKSGLLPISVAVLLFVTLELVLITFYVNWMKVFEAYLRGGIKEGLSILLRESILVITLQHPELKRRLERARASPARGEKIILLSL